MPPWVTNTKEQGLYNYRHVWQRTKNKGISMNRHVMYTYEYANSAWKNNELKQSHTIEGVLKSSCPVQRCMCVTLYMHCDSRRYHSNEEKEQTNQQWPTKYTQKPQNSAKWTQGVLEKISFPVPPVAAVWLTPYHKNYYFDLSYTGIYCYMTSN